MMTTSLSLPGTVFHTKCSRPKGESDALAFQTFLRIDCESEPDGAIAGFELSFWVLGQLTISLEHAEARRTRQKTSTVLAAFLTNTTSLPLADWNSSCTG